MDLTLPNLGEGADSGIVVNFFVKEGDELTVDQPVLELENEKAVATIPSTAAGKITKIYVKSGDKLSVGQKILSLTETKEDAPAKGAKVEAGAAAKARPAAEKDRNASEQEERGEPKEREEAASPEEEEQQQKSDDKGPPAEIAASPSLRKMAQELGIDLRRVRGSQRGGRIVLEDVRAYIQKLQSRAPQAGRGPHAAREAGTAAPPTESIDFSKWGSISKKPMSSLRQVIARRMRESWTTIPHVTQFDEADITGLMALRKKFVDAYKQKGAHLTLTSFALKAVAGVLKKHPVFNSSLDETANEIVLKEYIHIGVAVDTEAGLIVPVIRDVDKKNLLQLSKELEELAKKARDRKISSEELKGGSFTISNQGGIGGAHFTPIVNKPEVAILGLGQGQQKPTVRGDKIEPRLMLPLALSHDHRVIDGAAAARFMVDLVAAVEGFKEADARI